MAPVPNTLGFAWALRMGILTKHIFRIKPKTLFQQWQLISLQSDHTKDLVQDLMIWNNYKNSVHSEINELDLNFSMCSFLYFPDITGSVLYAAARAGCPAQTLMKPLR